MVCEHNTRMFLLPLVYAPSNETALRELRILKIHEKIACQSAYETPTLKAEGKTHLRLLQIANYGCPVGA